MYFISLYSTVQTLCGISAEMTTYILETYITEHWGSTFSFLVRLINLLAIFYISNMYNIVKAIEPLESQQVA